MDPLDGVWAPGSLMGGEPYRAENSDVSQFQGPVVSCTPNAGVADPYQQAIDSRHPDIAPTVAFSLGAMLQQQGGPDRRSRRYQQAIDSDHRDQVPNAATGLGILLQEQGDITGARGQLPAGRRFRQDRSRVRSRAAAANTSVRAGFP
jgi:hypothetical protein